MIYLDNNATTMMSVEAIQSMVDWCNKGNPSSGYTAAANARDMMNEFRALIGELCSISTCCSEVRDNNNLPTNDITDNINKDSTYKVIFTSGASEANCFVLGQIISAYQLATNTIPHVVMSAIEHKSLYSMMESYVERGLAQCTFVVPTPSGHIFPADVAKAIKTNTCLVCVMHANNETGAINDIAEIGALAHAQNIPFHCDTVQTFGKTPIHPITCNVDSFCISFHKFGGPPGVGALVIKSALISGYKISPMIFGSQMMGLRGGTENIPGIGAALIATQLTMNAREEKNMIISSLRALLYEELCKTFLVRSYSDYLKRQLTSGLEIILLSKPTQYYSPGVLLLSVVNYDRIICNTKIKDALMQKNIIISIGSACNTASAKASHVLYAMRADDRIRRGALRISIGDCNGNYDIITFVKIFTNIILNGNIYK